ncbi:MAG: hypothetical protein R6V57_18710 [Vicinamibacterales bacterium]
MRTPRRRSAVQAAAVAAVCLLLASPRGAAAADDPQRPTQPPPSQGHVVVEQVYNGPAFGVEFKYTEMNRDDAFLLGGYLGILFDNKLFVGGAGYWQVDDGYGNYYGYDDYYYGHDDYYGYNDYYGANGYGGLLVEWYALRSSAVSLSARGLVGGGIATVGRRDDVYIAEAAGGRGMVYPPPPAYYVFDQSYFVFEPQVNLTVRFAPGMALVGGVGYRVIGWANGWEDQIQGLTGTFAIRFGGGR